MKRVLRRRRIPLAALAITALGLTACQDSSSPLATDPIQGDVMAAANAATSGESFLRLYNRNVFLGGDTGPLFEIDFTQFPGNVVEVVGAVQTFWGQVQASDFPARAEAIADDIAATRPHVVGLNEMTSYLLVDLATGPFDGIDFTTVLLDALAARGLDYRLEIKQDNTSAQFPFALGPTGVTQVVALTVSDLVLVRGDVDVVSKANGNYLASLDLGVLEVKRGWGRVSISHRGAVNHVFVTHLETQGLQPIHNLQADELLALSTSLEGPTFVMGDLNSDAENGPPAPSWTPTYGKFLEAGFVDGWLEKTGEDRTGFTCCWDPDLAAGELDERIDFILVRAPDAQRAASGLPGAIQMDLLGDEESDRLPEAGIFPGDHVGIYGAFNLPGGLVR
jgi:hypothetical protein